MQKLSLGWESYEYKASLNSLETGCMKWNKEAIAKYVWNIAQKVDNLWVWWINTVQLNRTDWWLTSHQLTIFGT